MPRSFSDNAIAAKARAMYGRRLSQGDYFELTKRSSVPEAAAYLRDNTYYRDVLARTDVASIHRGQLEHLLRQERYDRYLRLTGFDLSGAKKFYGYLFLWDEIRQIIDLLRSISAGGSSFHIPDVELPHCSYDMEHLCRARTYQEVCSALQGTGYRRILEKQTPPPGAPPDMAAIERELTSYYYQQIFSMIQAEFPRGTARELREFFLWQIADQNLCLAYRLRRFFGASPQEARACLLPFSTPGHRLTEAVLQARPQELDQLLIRSRLCRGVSDPDPEFVESLTLRLRNQYTRKLLRYSTYAPVILVAYISQMEVELYNIINVVEAIRYQLPPSEIPKMLIL